jgi:hypothetical protein
MSWPWGRGRTGRPRGKPGRRRVRRRFTTGDPVPGHRAGALARGGAGELNGGFNFARGGWEEPDRGEVAELCGGSRRRRGLGGDRGQGSGVLSPWWCGEAIEPSELPVEQPEGVGERRSLPARREGRWSRCSGARGRGRRVAEAGAGHGGARGSLSIGARGEGEQRC